MTNTANEVFYLCTCTQCGSHVGSGLCDLDVVEQRTKGICDDCAPQREWEYVQSILFEKVTTRTWDTEWEIWEYHTTYRVNGVTVSKAEYLSHVEWSSEEDHDQVASDAAWEHLMHVDSLCTSAYYEEGDVPHHLHEAYVQAKAAYEALV